MRPFPDSSPTGLGAHPKCMKLLQNYYARVVADFFSAGRCLSSKRFKFLARH